MEGKTRGVEGLVEGKTGGKEGLLEKVTGGEEGQEEIRGERFVGKESSEK